MNKVDHKKASNLLSDLEELQSKFETIKDSIRELAEAEREKFENLTDGLQQSEKGQAIEQAADCLDSAADADSIQDAIDELGNLEG